MKSKTRRWLFIVLHLTGFVLLWFVVKGLDWNSFLSLLGEFPLWKYMTGLVVLCVILGIKALRWQLLNRSFGISTTWRTAFVFYLAAGFLSVITPGRLGEFAKIYFLKRRYDIDIPTATSSVFLDRIWDILVLSMAAGISLLILMRETGLNILSLVLIGLLFMGSLVVVLTPALFFRPVLFLSRRFPGLHTKIDGVYMLWKENRFSNFIPSLVFSAASFLMLASLPVLFSHGTPCPVPFIYGVGSISISNILSFLPVSIAGFGTRELVFTEIWKLANGTKELALSVSTAYFMIIYLGSLIIGGAVYLFNLKSLYRPSEIRNFKAE